MFKWCYMLGQYKETPIVEFHPIKFEWAEKEFIGALAVIGISGHSVAWAYSRVLLLRNKERYGAKFTNQHKAERAFRKVVREGRKLVGRPIESRFTVCVLSSQAISTLNPSNSSVCGQ